MADLADVLAMAQARGFIGPQPLEVHLDVVQRFRSVWPDTDGPCVDLGAGGGIPGLALAVWGVGDSWRLLEAQQRRAEFLDDAIRALGLTDTCVDGRRAELVGRDPAVRGTAATVTARGFGRPATTAECAAGLLRSEGWLLVSEPPGGDGVRWPADGLAQLGLRLVDVVDGIARLQSQDGPLPRWPRRDGVPRRRPVF